MLRNLRYVIALGALAGGMVAPAAAGDYRYTYPYASRCASCAPYYVVDQGPTWVGPGIAVAAGYNDLDPELPVVYPYVGPRYWYRPYDGGPYADPVRHLPYHRYHSRYYWPADVGPGPQIIRVGGHMRRPMRAPRHSALPPIDK